MPPGATAQKCRPWHFRKFSLLLPPKFLMTFFLLSRLFSRKNRILIFAPPFCRPLPLAITLLVKVLKWPFLPFLPSFSTFITFSYTFSIFSSIHSFFYFSSTLFCRPCTSAARGDSPPLPPVRYATGERSFFEYQEIRWRTNSERDIIPHQGTSKFDRE